MHRHYSSAMFLSAFTLLAAFGHVAASMVRATNFALPPDAVYIDPLRFNVLGANYSNWRTNNSLVGFNPTNHTSPFIQVFDPSFLDVTGPNATIRLIASNTDFDFAEQGPIYVPDLNVVFFASKPGGSLSYVGWNNNSVVSMLNLTELDIALGSTNGSVNIQVQTVNLPDTVQIASGGTGPYKGNLLFATTGRALLPPSVVLVNPFPPHNATVLLDNFFGRQFNSLRDIRVLPGTDIIYFIDDAYGAAVFDSRPIPMLPEQVYRFDPSTGQVRVVADQFIQPNGIGFSADGRSAFVTDTGEYNFQFNQTFPATVYKYDVDPISGTFTNRRVFNYGDAGILGSIKLDTNGNVYAGSSGGVQVWNPEGTLIGKFFLVGNVTTTNVAFTSSGLLMFSGETIHLINIQAQGVDLTTC